MEVTNHPSSMKLGDELFSLQESELVKVLKEIAESNKTTAVNTAGTEFEEKTGATIPMSSAGYQQGRP